MDKVTMKIDRKVYKDLQKVKINEDCKSLSDTIKYLMDEVRSLESQLEEAIQG